ncbi:hypothetical protein SO802_017233 [Lithocarpus litseifolius]|uniref:BED-type domain-containing protein n=1 Tax=Lithocarpus litseifolius TaxID=425828 RepID=A0AAW2D0U3_9ROSI
MELLHFKSDGNFSLPHAHGHESWFGVQDSTMVMNHFPMLESRLHFKSKTKSDFLLYSANSQIMETSSDAPPSQTTPSAQAEPAVQAEPLATPTNAEALPPKPNSKTKVSEIATNCGSNRKKSTAWDHFEKIKISEGQFKAVCHYCQKASRANSKGHSTTSLLNHIPNCVKNPNRASLKGQQTLAFEPKMNGEEVF